MSNIVDEIFKILEEHRPEDKEHCQRASKAPGDSLKKVKTHVEQLLSIPRCNTGSIEYASLNKMLALCNLKMGNELKAIHHLIESHAVILRQQILHRYLKTEMREKVLNIPQTYGLKSMHVKFDKKSPEIEALKVKLAELPKEWYIVQITAQYKPLLISKYTSLFTAMHAVHITVLPTGKSTIDPICITLPKPEPHFGYDVCHEIQNILNNNRAKLVASYANNELYWKMREKQNNKMKTAVHSLEYTWLREWRILFMADPADDSELVTDLLKMIDKLVTDYRSSGSISKRSRWLLKKIALGACFLSKEDIARAVMYVLPNHEKLAGNIILSIYGKLPCVNTLRSIKRKTLVLIVDEHMDYIPYESMEILQSHPVTRFPSFHVTYALFKEHEKTMRDGCKIIKAKDNMGTCIVNPSGNLSKMEKRMRLFIEYWLPQWNSWYNIKPDEEVFEDALINREILMYNGHGSGIQYLSGDQIEKLKVKAIVLLFGCSSVKLVAVGGRYPPYGISNQYLIAISPCVLGMLWEVTDADIDKMTANFISNWIPSSPDRPWSDVDINAWCCGKLKFNKKEEKEMQEIAMEPEMLRAVAKSKKVCSQYMTAAAIVVRGLPTRLE